MEQKRYTYPKAEKLKSRALIGSLFEGGKSVGKYPLRLVYVPLPEEDGDKTLMGVSVSKKHFKRAHDRNYYKRVLRECYRLHKHLLLDNLQKPYAIMFFYQTKDRLPYAEIEAKTVQLFEKFRKEEGAEELRG